MTLVATVTNAVGATASATTTLAVSPPKATTVYGASMHNAADFSRLAGLGLPVKAVRVFLDGPPASWASHPVLGHLPAGTMAVLSFMSGTVAETEQFLRARPTNLGRVVVARKHEPEDDIAAGTLKLADWQAAQREFAPMLRDLGCTPAMILMYYTLTARSRNVADYYLSEAHDLVLFDGYNAGNKAVPPVYNDPAKMVATVAAFGASINRPWGFSEVGSPVINSPDARAAWAGTFAATIAKLGGVCGIWWDGLGQKDPAAPFDARLDAPTATVWHA